MNTKYLIINLNNINYIDDELNKNIYEKINIFNYV